MRATFKRYPIEKLIIANLLISVFLFIFFSLIFPGIFKMWELKTIDYRFQMRHWAGKEPKDAGHVVQVNVDEYAYEMSNKNMWSRPAHGDVMETLGKAGAKTLGIDFYFSGKSIPEEDESLLTSVANAGICVMPVLFQTNIIHPESSIDYEKCILEHGGPELKELPPYDETGSKLIKAVGLAAPPLEGIWSLSHGIGFVNLIMDADGVV